MYLFFQSFFSFNADQTAEEIERHAGRGKFFCRENREGIESPIFVPVFSREISVITLTEERKSERERERQTLLYPNVRFTRGSQL